MSFLKQPKILLFIGLTLITLFLFFLKPFTSLDNKINDLIVGTNGERLPDNKIIIVEIDDASIKAMEKKWPWKRSILANGFANIANQNPKIIGLDFIFSDPGDSDDDQYFEKKISEISQKTPIVCASNFSVKKESAQINQQKMMIIEENLDVPFIKIPSGFVNVQLDSDQIIRRVQLIKDYKNQKHYFFSLVLASYIEGFKLNEVQYEMSQKIIIPKKDPIYLDSNQSSLINFAGFAGTYKKISFFQVYQNLLPENFFKDKIVLIGPTLTLTNDYHLTPFSDYQNIQSKMSGIEILANILENILNQKFYYQLSFFFQLVLLLGMLGVFFYLANHSFSLKTILIVLLGGGSLYCGIIIGIYLIFGAFCMNTIYLLCGAAFSVLIFAHTLKKRFLSSYESLNKVQLNDEFVRKYNISQREREIIILIIDGLDNNQIGKKLFISLSTVKKHIYSVFQKAGINKREELVKLIAQYSKES